ncbi:MAG: cation-translocating P-type ATPase [Clostridiales bacterium]|nr:cation-translocating P-type ATPase [Clostridiales bacterium]
MDKKFHTLTASQTLSDLKTSMQGLSQIEVKKRQQQFGKNELVAKSRTSFWLRLLKQLNDPLIMIMIGAVIISTSIAVYNGKPSELIDGGVILLILIVNAMIGIIQEGKAETALLALKKMSKPFCTVVRDGQESRIATSELVNGDIVVLVAGDNIPADLRLIESIELTVEEAALTGESMGVVKNIATQSNPNLPIGDRTNMVYSSGVVLSGRGKGVVIGIGMCTEVGKIATLISEQPTQKTPLQRQLFKTANIISLSVVVLSCIIFVVALFNKTSVVESFMTAVAIAVAAIPEGLPAILTIVLAVGVRKMSLKRAIIRNIPSVEVLGNTQVICSDKTGTLTQNKMTVVQLYTLDAKVYDGFKRPTLASQMTLAKAMVFCNDAKFGADQILGDPTEIALINYAKNHSLLEHTQLEKRVKERAFDSERKLMTVVMESGSVKTAYTKGANDCLLKLCTHIYDGTRTRPITDIDKSQINNVCYKMSNEALRVLGVAIKTHDVDKLETDLTFVGLCGMIDPPRPEVAEAVNVCKRAGIKTIMITGDHATTASAIARQIGIEGKVVTGAELDSMTDAQIDSCILKCGIFARVSPQNKVRIVNTLKGKGLVVAMTGDGVNDAPSIKAADIGIGMGISGTDVSKGAADMILADDNFATIIGAVQEGRRIYDNIKKAIRFLLSANTAEVLSLFIISVILRKPFLTPIMILLVNLITDSLPALALGLEKPEIDVMNRPPERKNKSLFAGAMGMQILIQGLLQTGLVMLSYIVANFVIKSVEPRLGLAMVFVTLINVQLFHAYNCKSEQHSLFKSSPFSNTFLNISFLIGFGLVVAIIYIPTLSAFFKLPGLTIWEFLIALGFAAMIIPIVEIYKLIEKKLTKVKSK